MNDPIQEGTTLGRYELLNRLATGGMAEVWLARDTKTDVNVVLKTLLPHLSDDDELLQLFLDEAELARYLDHRNVVRCLELGEAHHRVYIAMELVLGRTIRQVQRRLLKQRKIIAPWFLLRTAVAVCDALDHAHNCCDDEGQPLGIVHRDVTPENIMIDFGGPTKVLDFGIAKARESANSRSMGAIAGKLAYLSPEQVTAEDPDAVDARADIHGLGVVLYEMLTGMQPFRAANDMALLLKIPHQLPTPPSVVARWVPSRLSAIVMKALAKDPDHRYQTAAELGRDLEAYLDSLPKSSTESDMAAYMHNHFHESERRIPVAGTSTIPPPRPDWISPV